jgi:hypothetical protein
MLYVSQQKQTRFFKISWQHRSAQSGIVAAAELATRPAFCDPGTGICLLQQWVQMTLSV